MTERHRLMALLADGCASGSASWPSSAVDAKNAVIRVRRGVVRSRSAGVIATTPKSEAGIRDVPIPPDILDAVREHNRCYAAAGAQGLMCPGRNGGHLSPSVLREGNGVRRGSLMIPWVEFDTFADSS